MLHELKLKLPGVNVCVNVWPSLYEQNLHIVPVSDTSAVSFPIPLILVHLFRDLAMFH